MTKIPNLPTVPKPKPKPPHPQATVELQLDGSRFPVPDGFDLDGFHAALRRAYDEKRELAVRVIGKDCELLMDDCHIKITTMGKIDPKK